MGNGLQLEIVILLTFVATREFEILQCSAKVEEAGGLTYRVYHDRETPDRQVLCETKRLKQQFWQKMW